MTWWGNALNKGSKDPKRKNRFLIQMGNTAGSGYILDAKSVSKPKLNIEPKEYRMINHYYSYPGLVKWDPITITFVDNGNFSQEYKDRNGGTIVSTNHANTSDALWEMLLASGYSTPNGRSGISQRAKSISSPEKASTIDNSFGSALRIFQLDSNGKKVESWELHNPIITKISWGDLNYSEDSLTEYSIDVKYDWATLYDADKDSNNDRGTTIESDGKTN